MTGKSGMGHSALTPTPGAERDHAPAALGKKCWLDVTVSPSRIEFGLDSSSTGRWGRQCMPRVSVGTEGQRGHDL